MSATLRILDVAGVSMRFSSVGDGLAPTLLTRAPDARGCRRPPAPTTPSDLVPLLADGCSGRVHDPPHAALALALDVAGRGVLREVVERPLVVRHLVGAVLAVRRGDEGLVGALAGLGLVLVLDGQHRPGVLAGVVAGARALGVRIVEVQ